MNIMQSWSGGYDSTYLLCKNLNEKNVVYPVYISCLRVGDLKIECEKKAIREIESRLNSENLKRIITSEVYINSNVLTRYSYQPFLWLLGLYNEVVSRPEVQFDQVHIGYIMNDDALSFQEDLKDLWANFFKFDFETVVNNKKIPELIFPLKKMGKEIIIKGLYSQGILDLCWSCADPIYVNGMFHYCGECTSCKHLKESLRYSDESKKPKYDKLYGRLKVLDQTPYTSVEGKQYIEYDSISVESEKNIKNIKLENSQLLLDFGYVEEKEKEKESGFVLTN